MISNMSLKQKLFVLVGTMLAVLFLFVFTIVNEKYKSKTNFEKLEITVSLSSIVSHVTHEAQKERALSSAYIESYGKEYSNELAQQRKATDVEIKALMDIINKNNMPKLQEKFNEVKNLVNGFPSIRSKVDSLSIDTLEVVNYIAKMNYEIIEIMAESSKYSNSPIATQELNSYVNLLFAKEKAGIERALGFGALTANMIEDDENDAFVSAIYLQNAFLNSFTAYATTEGLEFYNKTFNTPIMNDIKKMREILLSKDRDYGIQPSLWYDKMTQKINLYKKVDDYLAQEMMESVNKEISSATQSLIIFAVIAVIGVFIIIFISFMVSRDIIAKIGIFQNGLLDFFNFINKQSKDVKLIPLSSKDEFGTMSAIINQNIKKTEKLLAQETLFLEEVSHFVNETKDGHFTYRFKDIQIDNEALKSLKVTLNEMIERLHQLIAHEGAPVIVALEEFGKLDFRKTIPNATGVIEVKINELCSLINNMLKTNKANGLTLQNSANVLLNNVEKLSTASNATAASLEETAAALEEITSNIRNNTHNIGKMSTIANGVTTSANQGEKLASDTTIAMEEINEQVNAINEAIAVIDQIAFQTNILSLNAAVEAATAGEAGKGFAVVAAEVRNLASRSAEAAKEIKELVENATIKANDGKTIATNMIKGYEELNGHIVQTMDLIKNIEDSSKEQLIGIEQINNAVAQLDLQTQQNAQVALQTQQIAQSTNSIANDVVTDANEKEFVGKDEVMARQL